MSSPGESTLIGRRPSAHSLPKLDIQRPEAVSPLAVVAQSDDITVKEGKCLFEHFLHHRITQEGLQTPKEFLSPTVSTPQGYRNPLFAKAGRELRMMADEFAKTRERDRVKQRAEQVTFNVTPEEFRDLLSELFFQGEVTQSRIVVLFFFCSDIAIRTLKEGVALFRKFWTWSVQFIVEKVCSWVRDHGGWGEVFCGSMTVTIPKMAIFGFGFMVAVFLWKYWLKK